MYRGERLDLPPLCLTTTGRLTTAPSKFIGNVYCMMQDAGGILWLGTRGQGLVRAVPAGEAYALRRFLSRPDDEYSLSSNDIYALCQDRKRHICVGAYLSGMNLLKQAGERKR